MYNVVIDGDDGGVALSQVHDLIESIARNRLLYHVSQPTDNSQNSFLSSSGHKANNQGNGTNNNMFAPRVDVSSNISLESSKSINVNPALLYRATVRCENGLYRVGGPAANFTGAPLRSWKEYINDVQRLKIAVNNSRCVEACVHRLGIIQERTRMFFLRNGDLEEQQHIGKCGGVFASASRVNPFVSFDRCVNRTFAWEYIVNTCTRKQDTCIIRSDGVETTIAELLHSNGVTDFVNELCADDVLASSDVVSLSQTHMSSDTLHFDRGNNNNNINNNSSSSSRSNSVNAHMSNESKSDMLAELVRELQYTFCDIRGSLALRMFKRYVQTNERNSVKSVSCDGCVANEYAIPFYGVDAMELENIATSMCQGALENTCNTRWYLQLKLTSLPSSSSSSSSSRSVYTGQRACESIQDQLDCLFMPLFTETLHMISFQHTQKDDSNEENIRFSYNTSHYTGNASLACLIDMLGGLIIDIPCNEYAMVKNETEQLPKRNLNNRNYHHYNTDISRDNINKSINDNAMKSHAEFSNRSRSNGSSITSQRISRNKLSLSKSLTEKNESEEYEENMEENTPSLEEIACYDQDDPYFSHYYYYYIYANLTLLNALRVRHQMPPWQLRLLANHFNGEDDIVAGYFIADVILRATKLAHYPVLQYLYGFSHIGLTFSPLTDHVHGACALSEHPLPQFLHECLYVAMATEENTNVHDGDNDALLEEYATAQNIFRLSPLDMTELAWNSVRMSSFYWNDNKCRQSTCDCNTNVILKNNYNGNNNGFSEEVDDGNDNNTNHENMNVRNWLHTRQVSQPREEFRRSIWETEREIMRDLYFKKGNKQPSKLITNKLLHGQTNYAAAEMETAGLSRWHYLTSVQHVEYHNVLDSRVRFPRTIIRGPYTDPITTTAAPLIARALKMRSLYSWQPPKPWERNTCHEKASNSSITKRKMIINSNNSANMAGANSNNTRVRFDENEWVYAASDAVFIAYAKNAIHAWPRSLPTIEQFHAHIDELKLICAHPQVCAFARSRLQILDYKFNLHLALNHANEAGTTVERQSANRDFYQANKVDTHIHMAAGMTPKQILQFILQKLRDSGDDIAMKKGETILTLGELFAKVGITEELTVDQLNVQADHTLFERFDNFNNKYNPLESGELRSLLLKTDNFMNGRYFAEMIREVFTQYARDAYTYAENRLSVYGINVKEWDKLATWFITHGMSSKHNKWVIQVPRVYKVFRAQNVIGSFGQYLENIFQPLWEASLHPSRYPVLHHFLSHVSGFDSVDNEATLDLPFQPVSPWAWTSIENPPYNYYIYYLYANIRTLNEFRAKRGFSTFALRPHCGESGSDEHLFGAYLCANGICHGINLRNDNVMQYLYYLTQIGLHVSPLSNNALFLRFVRNPFPEFFRRGLNVSLSTDDPMMFHYTQEPLIEEYSIAARVWGFSPNDLCELARNSVLQCGFDDTFKRRAIGERYYMSSSLGNDPLRTHLSDIRVAFRFETYHTELKHLEMVCGQSVPRFMMTTLEEREINERNYDVAAEKVLLSTHDQEMEIMVRDIEAKREHIRVNRVKVEALRRKQRSLIDGITEIGIRRQEREDDEARKRSQKRLTYTRESRRQSKVNKSHPYTANSFESNNEAMSKRLLHWFPTSTNMLHTYVEQLREMTTRKTKPRQLPPLHFST